MTRSIYFRAAVGIVVALIVVVELGLDVIHVAGHPNVDGRRVVVVVIIVVVVVIIVILILLLPAPRAPAPRPRMRTMSPAIRPTTWTSAVPVVVIVANTAPIPVLLTTMMLTAPVPVVVIVANIASTWLTLMLFVAYSSCIGASLVPAFFVVGRRCICPIIISPTAMVGEFEGPGRRLSRFGRFARVRSDGPRHQRRVYAVRISEHRVATAGGIPDLLAVIGFALRDIALK